MNESQLPIACDMSAIAPEERGRHEERTRRIFGTEVRGVEELPNGYRYRLDPALLGEVAAFVANERRCCPFFDFSIELPAGEEALWLRLTGPEGAKELLEAAGGLS